MMDPWKESEHFKNDHIEFPEKTSRVLVHTMDLIRTTSRCKVNIHRCYDPSATLATSRHRMDNCDACDFDMEPLEPSAPQSLFQQFLFLTRFSIIKGIGIYPHWNRPGFHVDMRPEVLSVYWIRNKDGLYLPINDKSMKEEVLVWEK